MSSGYCKDSNLNFVSQFFSIFLLGSCQFWISVSITTRHAIVNFKYLYSMFYHEVNLGNSWCCIFPFPSILRFNDQLYFSMFINQLFQLSSCKILSYPCFFLMFWEILTRAVLMCCNEVPSWSILGENFYGTFRMNINSTAREIYETLEERCR